MGPTHNVTYCEQSMAAQHVTAQSVTAHYVTAPVTQFIYTFTNVFLWSGCSFSEGRTVTSNMELLEGWGGGQCGTYYLNIATKKDRWIDATHAIYNPAESSRTAGIIVILANPRVACGISRCVRFTLYTHDRHTSNPHPEKYAAARARAHGCIGQASDPQKKGRSGSRRRL